MVNCAPGCIVIAVRLSFACEACPARMRMHDAEVSISVTLRQLAQSAVVRAQVCLVI